MYTSPTSPRPMTAEQAVSLIQSGQSVIAQQCAAVPTLLLDALAQRAQELRDVRVFNVLNLREMPLCRPELTGHFRYHTIFASASTREALASGRADFTCCHFSQLPALIGRELAADVALVMVSPPDAQGWCSLGVSVDYAKAAVERAGLVIAQVNDRMPRTLGGGLVHISQLDVLVEHSEPIAELPPAACGPVELAIGRHCAGLIHDGDTLQLGIGAIPDAVLQSLRDKKDLGIHSEMISDGVVDLMEAGVINGKRKTLHPGKAIVTFLMGSSRLYEFVDNNPQVEAYPVDYVNDPRVIAQNDNMVTINSCLEADLTGQINAETLGGAQYSGTGGQVDFVRGSAMSRGGRAIIAMPSTTRNGKHSRIVANLSPSSAVTTCRCDVDYVVTEYGVAALRGKTLAQRAKALIAIAHPDFRPGLEDAYSSRYTRE